MMEYIIWGLSLLGVAGFIGIGYRIIQQGRAEYRHQERIRQEHEEHPERYCGECGQET